MYFKDFTNYNYLKNSENPYVKNIGWLSNEHVFSQGNVSETFLEKLEHLICHQKVNTTRGVHRCEFCTSKEHIYIEKDNKKCFLGNFEIWLPSVSEHILYAAPSLVYHYISKHNYLPPLDFINSVTSNLDSTWFGSFTGEDLIRIMLK